MSMAAVLSIGPRLIGNILFHLIMEAPFIGPVITEKTIILTLMFK